MSFASLPPTIQQIALEVCTEKELQALRLWEDGLGYRRIGRALGISWNTARDRVHRANAKIAADPRTSREDAA